MSDWLDDVEGGGGGGLLLAVDELAVSTSGCEE